MQVEKEILYPHEFEPLKTILSDPTFVLPRVFPPIKNTRFKEGSFESNGKFMGMQFNIEGNYYIGSESVTYTFILKAGRWKGNGKLVIELKPQQRKINVKFSYEGWMDTLSKTFFMSKWFNDFASKLDEEVRLERIRRKI
ncbi:hypothetical protein CM19_03895 [Candidatus Acidianus copahuensis]|uniref:DUF3211 domain-containing protein n=1 Tax=Candidatus Acidianus copahuensis TaxID=1160895 RepID=A0A031LS80_9CREN|nr:DUF3211 domain-containing protein [Candidatus Acidianus copahuensis]EZQ10580.1 hypothetical protein CM19_03895 [Candidatus Acidianus copahuensis]